MRHLMLAIAMLVIASCTGCANLSTAENEPLNAGATRLFNGDYDRVLNATRIALADSGLEVNSEKPCSIGTMLLAQRGVTAWSWGESVRAIVSPTKAGTAVRILTDRALAFNVTAKDFAENIFTNISIRLGDSP